ncbi:MAG: ribosome biogenesis GTP-binding protein YihA/YsxC [Desulfobulbaceae bacterium]|jgi:GTP-binding protein|nr:ribosome biogenesis GTP-binding protein YihA/YsxC [Desulfobulbaceae bacterium]
MRIFDVRFSISVHRLNQLPQDDLPEVAFAGRSNVGKSSLLNRILDRRDYIKVSGKPGKTQGLNFFLCDERLYFVDLPGYGFARVSRAMREDWGELIASYLEKRRQLKAVVVIMDIRHPATEQDGQLLAWLAEKSIPAICVYTKADKLSGNERGRQATLLDAGHSLTPERRILFSAKTGLGKDALLAEIARLVDDKQENRLP